MSTTWRSLVVTRLSPFPPTAGVPLRVAAYLRGLAELGPVDVIIVGDTPSGQIPDHIDRVETYPAEPSLLAPITSRVGPRHPLAARLHSRDVEAAIQRLGAGPGVVVLAEVWMAPYLNAARSTGRPVVYDSHNVETVLRHQIASVGRVDVARRIRRSMITAQVRRLEARMIAETDQAWVCSNDDEDALSRLFRPAAEIRVVPNAVDATSIAADVDAGVDPVPPVGGETPTVVFLGDLGYTPNEDGARHLIDDVMPRIREAVPTALAVLVGRRPTEALRRAAGEAGAVITGEVASVLPYLAHGSLLAVTLRIGGGTRLKILEAMAAGIPIVTTSKGLEGIDALDGLHLRVADGSEAFAAAAVDVLTNPAAAADLAHNARALVHEHYSWEATGRRVRAAATVLGHPSAVS